MPTQSAVAGPRWPAWLQFPRRALLLLAAYGLCLLLLAALRSALGGGLVEDWGVSITSRQPVADIIADRLPTSLGLVVLAQFVALGLAMVGTALGLALRRLGAGLPAAGAGAGCLARLAVYALAAVPPFVLAVLAIYLFTIRLRLLSGGLLFGGPGGAGSLVRLLLPAMLLAWFPALAATQAALRALWGPGTRGRRLAQAACAGLGMLALQTGGLLGLLLPIETVFALPGLGRVLVQSVAQRDLPVVLGVVTLAVGLVVVARLLAEALFAAARLVSAAPVAEPVAHPPPARRLGLALSLALLLVPLAFAAAGLLTPAERALEISVGDRGLGPSADHPWGTDSLGRDVQARVLRGALNTLGLALGVGLLATLPAALWGALTSALARRRQLWSESLADVLLLPADIGLLIPSLLLLVILVAFPVGLLFENVGLSLLVAFVAAAVLLRAARAAFALWTSAPAGLSIDRRLATGLGGIFLAATWYAVWLLAPLDMLGLGVPPPTPSLGGLVTEALQFAAQQPAALLAPSLVLAACALALYTAAGAVLGQLWGRAVTGWFNA